jgi:hypothetical protein
MKKAIATFISAIILLMSVNSAQAEVFSGHVWDQITRYAIQDDYQFGEQSDSVRWLQYIIGAKPDGVYGPETFNRHSSTLMKYSDIVASDHLPVWRSSPRTFRDSVEVWRPISTEALAYYDRLHELDRFLALMQCESGGIEDAVNPSSGATGLLQHLPQFWDARARVAVGGRFAGEPATNGEANIWVSAWLMYEATGGGWQHWDFGCL